MAWTCHTCTFHHGEAHMEEFLSCQICNAPRKLKKKNETNCYDGNHKVKERSIDGRKRSTGTGRVARSNVPSVDAKNANTIDHTATKTVTRRPDAKDSNSKTKNITTPSSTSSTKPPTTPLLLRQLQKKVSPTSEKQSPTLGALFTFLSSSNSSSKDNDYMIAPLDAYCNTYYQRDKWSCGYRNLQTLISFLFHLPFYEQVLVKSGLAVEKKGCSSTKTATRRSVSAITTIQQCIKCAWAAGYDPITSSSSSQEVAHRKQFSSNKTCSIGIVEFVTVLRYVGIPLNIRAWSNDRKEDTRSEWPNGAKTAAACLIDFVLCYFRKDSGAGDESSRIKPPLCLQRRGHSIMCVGLVTNAASVSITTKNVVALLISDPAVQDGNVQEVSVKQLSRSTAWEVGYLSKAGVFLAPEEGKVIKRDVFQSIS